MLCLQSLTLFPSFDHVGKGKEENERLKIENQVLVTKRKASDMLDCFLCNDCVGQKDHIYNREVRIKIVTQSRTSLVV